MGSQADFSAYCAELMATAGAVRSRRMFGGYGLYVDDLFVAIIVQDTLYLKTDDDSRHRFEAAGGRPFVYARQGKPQTMAFWTVPPDAMDSPSLMQPWVQLAAQAALRARTSPSARKRR